MKQLKIYLLIYLFIFINTKYAFTTELEGHLCQYKEVNLPYSSVELEKYYYLDEKTGIKLNPHELSPLSFSDKELNYSPKLFDEFAKGNDYYPLIYFYYKSILYKGIIYQGYADNDMNTFVFQLSSYDAQNNIIDAIVLDTRFRFEVMYWNDFIINNNGEIFIKKHSQQLHDYSKNNFNINGDIQILELNYQIGNDGIFRQIKR